ncbi:hypothetical protein LCGC14_1021870 [marine sediment metagenome]|uniref:Uncharacterized protein n=1 Tax=marine sediment metagenome TaxID=412755 RepID=A0A0F9QFB8_9ZZZZ
MQLNADNLNQITYRTKRHQLKKADAEIILALVPGSMMDEAQKIIADSPKPKKEDDLKGPQKKEYDKKMDAYSKAIKVFGFKILSASVLDDKGDPVFKDVKAFETLAPALQEEITTAMYDYNGMSEGSVKELVKN